ncbi:MAG: molybdenum cofactor guanylyltransferase [Myxococcota bacterium]
MQLLRSVAHAMLGVVTGRQAAIVLAGGRSVRMGRPKATLPWRGATMIESVVATLQQVTAQVVIVAHAEQDLPPLPGITRVDDPVTLDDQGPLVGAREGLAALHPDDVAYLAAVDKPLLDEAHVRFMLAQLRAGIDAAVPVEPADSKRRHRLHPLAAAVRVGPALREASRLIADGERALKRLFSALPCAEISRSALPNDAVLRDCNTPDDYEAARREFDA